MKDKSSIERGAGLSDLIARHNARIGIGRRWARIEFNLWLACRSPVVVSAPSREKLAADWGCVVNPIYAIPRKRKTFLIIACGSYFGIARSPAERDEKIDAAGRWLASFRPILPTAEMKEAA